MSVESRKLTSRLPSILNSVCSSGELSLFSGADYSVLQVPSLPRSAAIEVDLATIPKPRLLLVGSHATIVLHDLLIEDLVNDIHVPLVRTPVPIDIENQDVDCFALDVLTVFGTTANPIDPAMALAADDHRCRCVVLTLQFQF